VDGDGERSVCFDQAAAYYDQTRDRPGVGRERVLALILSELRGKGPCLDIGVGTGRIALPLVEAGMQVIGVDLSSPMMLRLRERSGGASMPLVAGDAMELPFRDDLFGTALIIHVLHSVPGWQHVIEEGVRVTRPGGIILVDPGNGRVPMLEEIEARFIDEIDQEPRRSEWTEQTVDETFARNGCACRRLPDVPVRFIQTPSAFIEQLERGQASWEWELDSSRFEAAGRRVRAWAERVIGDLDEPRELTTSVSIRAYDLVS
jgi:ubiquinone/menaquinone biosynthesis C-methylase UbiE